MSRVDALGGGAPDLGAGHHLEWRKTASLAGFEGQNCDLLLVDGASLWRDEAQRLRTCLAMQAGPGGGAAFYFDPAVDPRAKISTPVHLSCRRECGVYRTAAGHWSMRSGSRNRLYKSTAPAGSINARGR